MMEIVRENRKVFKIEVSKAIFQAFLNALKEEAVPSVEVAKIIKGMTKTGMKVLILALKDSEATDVDFFQAGSDIEKLKYKITAEELAAKAEKIKASKKKIMKLKFHKKIFRQFRDQYGEKTGFVTMKGTKGNFVEFHFDVSDISKRNDLVKRIALIFESVQAIKENQQMKNDQYQLNEIINHLQKHCSNFTQQYEEYFELSGSELIAAGFANVLDIDSKAASNFQKVLNWIFRKRKFTCFYFGEVVDPEKIYVVRTAPEKIDPIPLNHESIIRLTYRYGQQIYKGLGLELVQEYQKEIIDAYNFKLRQEKDVDKIG